MHKRTKIVCTIGPASASKSALLSMVKNGMNVARLNFSHGTHEDHGHLMALIREVEKETGEPIAIMQDLQGPKIRVGILPEAGIALKPGDVVIFDTAAKECTDNVIPVDYTELHHYVRADERILLHDGRIETRIKQVSGTRISAEVLVGGLITSHKGMNVPDSKLIVRAVTKKDKADLRFGIDHAVDWVAVSFVQSPEDIREVRGMIGDETIRIIAKIERHEAVKNIRAILAAADGIMVARGDLGVEIPQEDVPLVQKSIIREALQSAKPVIVATQMLDSMQENPRPTRAEVSDVANAVIDHADALMLSNETATGMYPVESTAVMEHIIIETEKSVYDNLILADESKVRGKESKTSLDTIMSELARLLAERVDASFILAASITGDTGRMISRYRPELPIYVGTSSERVRRQLNLSWGVIPFLLPPCDSIEDLVNQSLAILKKTEKLNTGDKVVVVAGEPVGQSGNVNLLEVREVK